MKYHQAFATLCVIGVTSASFIPRQPVPSEQYDAVKTGSALGKQFLDAFDRLGQAPEIAPVVVNNEQTRAMVQQRDILTNLIASALGVSSETVESLLATFRKIMDFYTMAEPLIEAINFPGLFAGFLQTIINHDIAQWLIHEVAPAMLPPQAIVSLNNILANYFGPRPPITRSVDPELIQKFRSMSFPL